MLTDKEEIHKGALRNFLSLIYSTEGLSTYFWIKKILEQSPEIKTFFRFYKVLQYSIPECSTKFYKILLAKFFNIREMLLLLLLSWA